MIMWINPTSQFHQIKPNWIKSPIRVVSSPRNSKFSQFNKLIKLNHKDHVYSIPQQKPINQFWKKKLKTTKIPKILRFEIPKYAWQKCMKLENKWKWKGNMVLPALGEKNLAKGSEENDKKNWLDALTDRIEKEKVLKSLKSVWTREKERF